MLVAFTWVILSFMIINALSEEKVPIKKITFQDKVVYKMRHDFWPKQEQRNGILPFLETISRRRRSPENNENTDANNTPSPYDDSTTFSKNKSLATNDNNNNIEIGDNNSDSNEGYAKLHNDVASDKPEDVSKIDVLHPASEEYAKLYDDVTSSKPDVSKIDVINPHEILDDVRNTESTTITEREEKITVLDLDVAENTLIFRPLFAYRYKKRRQKLRLRT